MAYTTIDKPSDYFETNLHTGTGSTHNITSLDFAPNFVWLKSRTQGGTGYNGMHYLFDTIRGATKRVRANDDSAEATSSASLTSFNSDGFTLGSDDIVNFNGDAFVSWNWKAGTSFTNDASATGIGNIDSTGSVNTDAGFSVISYTGDANADNTVAHGLNSVPKMIILKNRSISSNCMVYHVSTGAQAPLFLNLTNAAGSGDPDRFKVAPTSTVFTPGTAQEGNGSGNSIIAYCFAEKKGYSKFGNYVGNGNVSGTYIHLGFKPSFVMTKLSSADGEGWEIYNNKALGYNVDNNKLVANTSGTESTADRIDLLSNGFKARINSDGINASGGTLIYMAFAENPFVTSTGVPATAR